MSFKHKNIKKIDAVMSQRACQDGHHGEGHPIEDEVNILNTMDREHGTVDLKYASEDSFSFATAVL